MTVKRICRYKSLTGNPVKSGNDPVAVIGDQSCKMPLLNEIQREGAASRMIRESEDLPEMQNKNVILRGQRSGKNFVDKKRDIPGAIYFGPGIFFCL